MQNQERTNQTTPTILMGVFKKVLGFASAATLVVSLIFTFFLAFTPSAHAFCGFYVAKADTNLYNKASQVSIARDGNHTVLTMSNDYQGEVSDFAMVIPVPTVLQQEQVNVADPIVLDRLDDFSAPRLVEYFDSDPCAIMHPFAPGRTNFSGRQQSIPQPSAAPVSDAALGVTIEEQFSVGEYDILILSARESDGLETWLRQNDYRIPDGAREVLSPYIRQGLKFFVAKVNLSEFDQSGFQQLRPLQIEYDSPRFMLPIRLGMINAEAEQDLVVYLLSPQGQTELTNYRTVKIPTDTELPLFIQDEFGDFYPEMFQRSYEDAGKNVAFLEYAWDMRGCDPCSATPLNRQELNRAGAFWVRPETGSNVFITRLHVRYSRDKFPEDLMFQETGNRQFFQGRYVTRHPFADNIDCAARLQQEYPTQQDVQDLERNLRSPYEEIANDAIDRGEAYNRQLAERFEREAQTLAQLTGKDIREIRQRISNEVPQPTPSRWLIRHPRN